jgi:hypothetical protein
VDKEVMRTYPKPKKVCHKKNKMQEREKWEESNQNKTILRDLLTGWTKFLSNSSKLKVLLTEFLDYWVECDPQPAWNSFFNFLFSNSKQSWISTTKLPIIQTEDPQPLEILHSDVIPVFILAHIADLLIYIDTVNNGKANTWNIINNVYIFN